MTHILIAEDERGIATFVERGLRDAGFLTTIADNGETALLLARSAAFDLVVLDLGLPRLDGREVLRRLRDERIDVPVIILTARGGVEDTVSGLEAGAQDYMTKPFAVAELVARIRLRLRTGGVDPGAAAGGLEAGDLRLDVRGRRARCGETVVDLTAREFDLLETFMRHPDQVLSREQLLLHVWSDGVDPASNVVDVFVRTLRGKIGPDRIRTVRGLGYRLEVRS